MIFSRLSFFILAFFPLLFLGDANTQKHRRLQKLKGTSGRGLVKGVKGAKQEVISSSDETQIAFGEEDNKAKGESDDMQVGTGAAAAVSKEKDKSKHVKGASDDGDQAAIPGRGEGGPQAKGKVKVKGDAAKGDLDAGVASDAKVGGKSKDSSDGDQQGVVAGGGSTKGTAKSAKGIAKVKGDVQGAATPKAGGKRNEETQGVSDEDKGKGPEKGKGEVQGVVAGIGKEGKGKVESSKDPQVSVDGAAGENQGNVEAPAVVGANKKGVQGNLGGTRRTIRGRR